MEGRFINCSISPMQESLVAVVYLIYYTSCMHIYLIYVPTRVLVRMCVQMHQWEVLHKKYSSSKG